MKETWRKLPIEKEFEKAAAEGFEHMKRSTFEENSDLSTMYYYFYNKTIFQNIKPPRKERYIKETRFFRHLGTPEQVIIIDLYNEYDEKLYSGKFHPNDPIIDGEKQYLTIYSDIPGIYKGERINPKRIIFKLLVPGSESEREYIAAIAKHDADVTYNSGKFPKPHKDDAYEAKMNIIESNYYGVPTSFSDRKKKPSKPKCKCNPKKSVKKVVKKPVKKVVKKIKRK